MDQIIAQMLPKQHFVHLSLIAALTDIPLNELQKEVQKSENSFIGIVHSKKSYEFKTNRGTPIAVVDDLFLENDFDTSVNQIIRFELQNSKHFKSQIRKVELEKKLKQSIKGEIVYDTGIDEYTVVDQQKISNAGIIETKKVEVLVTKQTVVNNEDEIQLIETQSTNAATTSQITQKEEDKNISQIKTQDKPKKPVVKQTSIMGFLKKKTE
ncbi:Hypothetical_protein [Hexamita inflata]|uniref:Hypothetical_protein n=1 Tax=Hexamita inflata TaxID=28002 RepID=A0AA86RGF9_9EUKA|nr:Hypothetical protein HINF_LOCUS61888 [Hexamita inflata]